MQAIINIETLKAVNLAASGDESRYYLKGVYVEVAEKTVTYTATDGRVLLSRREDCAEPNTLTGSWIIPSDFIKSAKPSRHADHAIMTLAPGPNNSTMLAFTGTITGMAAPIDGTFADYRRATYTATDGRVLLSRREDCAEPNTLAGMTVRPRDLTVILWDCLPSSERRAAWDISRCITMAKALRP